MSMELERRLRQLEARVDELLLSLSQQTAAAEPATSEPKSKAAPARRLDANGRFVR
jgi:hypothetical protein